MPLNEQDELKLKEAMVNLFALRGDLYRDIGAVEAVLTTAKKRLNKILREIIRIKDAIED